jgi:hypothetical protein
MRKLTIDETWDYTKRMWKWVAFRIDTMLDERSVVQLKEVWLKENAPEFTGMTSDCFFCQNREGCCGTTCPGALVESGFSCCDPDHNYEDKPGAFYRKILRLDAIRTAAPPEHEWMRGDVLKCYDGTVVVCIQEKGEQIRVFGVNEREPNEYSADINLDHEATFLFNIRDIIKDKL